MEEALEALETIGNVSVAGRWSNGYPGDTNGARTAGARAGGGVFYLGRARVRIC